MTHASGHRFAWVLCLGLVGGALSVTFGDRLLTHIAYAMERGKLQATGGELARADEISNIFRKVARIARPGVVQIRVSGSEGEGPSWNDLMQRLRSGDMSEDEFRELSRKRRPAFGSGILFDKDGYVLTNNHVVSGRSDIRVRLADDRELEATLVGADEKSDLAVVKINAPDLHPLAFGDSDQMEVGDWVIAVGAPFGLSQTVTHGIISAKGRSDIGGVDIMYQDFLQTDAAINPGNSGGPLLNMRGEVIGVNTAIATLGDNSNAGVAFTIPSNSAVKVARDLKTTGEVARGWLGVQMSELTKDDAEILAVKDGRGVVVDGVLDATPASEAGLQPEDVIIAVNGRPFDSAAHMRGLIADVRPGEIARLDVVRDGQPKEVSVKLGRQPAQIGAAGRGAATRFRDVTPLGLKVRSLRPSLAEQIGYDSSERGVLVVRKEDERDGLNIAPGELIVTCNGQKVETVGALLKALDTRHDGKAVKLQVLSADGKRRTVLLEQ